MTSWAFLIAVVVVIVVGLLALAGVALIATGIGAAEKRERDE